MSSPNPVGPVEDVVMLSDHSPDAKSHMAGRGMGTTVGMVLASAKEGYATAVRLARLNKLNWMGTLFRPDAAGGATVERSTGPAEDSIASIALIANPARDAPPQGLTDFPRTYELSTPILRTKREDPSVVESVGFLQDAVQVVDGVAGPVILDRKREGRVFFYPSRGPLADDKTIINVAWKDALTYLRVTKGSPSEQISTGRGGPSPRTTEGDDRTVVETPPDGGATTGTQQDPTVYTGNPDASNDPTDDFGGGTSSTPAVSSPDVPSSIGDHADPHVGFADPNSQSANSAALAAGSGGAGGSGSRSGGSAGSAAAANSRDQIISNYNSAVAAVQAAQVASRNASTSSAASAAAAQLASANSALASAKAAGSAYNTAHTNTIGAVDPTNGLLTIRDASNNILGWLDFSNGYTQVISRDTAESRSIPLGLTPDQNTDPSKANTILQATALGLGNALSIGSDGNVTISVFSDSVTVGGNVSAIGKSRQDLNNQTQAKLQQQIDGLEKVKSTSQGSGSAGGSGDTSQIDAQIQDTKDQLTAAQYAAQVSQPGLGQSYVIGSYEAAYASKLAELRAAHKTTQPTQSVLGCLLSTAWGIGEGADGTPLAFDEIGGALQKPQPLTVNGKAVANGFSYSVLEASYNGYFVVGHFTKWKGYYRPIMPVTAPLGGDTGDGDPGGDPGNGDPLPPDSWPPAVGKIAVGPTDAGSQPVSMAPVQQGENAAAGDNFIVGGRPGAGSTDPVPCDSVHVLASLLPQTSKNGKTYQPVSVKTDLNTNSVQASDWRVSLEDARADTEIAAIATNPVASVPNQARRIGPLKGQVPGTQNAWRAPRAGQSGVKPYRAFEYTPGMHERVRAGAGAYVPNAPYVPPGGLSMIDKMDFNPATSTQQALTHLSNKINQVAATVMEQRPFSTNFVRTAGLHLPNQSTPPNPNFYRTGNIAVINDIPHVLIPSPKLSGKGDWSPITPDRRSVRILGPGDPSIDPKMLFDDARGTSAALLPGLKYNMKIAAMQFLNRSVRFDKLAAFQGGLQAGVYGKPSAILGTDLINGNLELGDQYGQNNGATPYIDFHIGETTLRDYHARIIADQNSSLTFTSYKGAAVTFALTGSKRITITQGLTTIDRALQFPDNSGTFALTSDIPSSLPPSGTAGGDLSGTYPNPGVAQLNGVAAINYARRDVDNTFGAASQDYTSATAFILPTGANVNSADGVTPGALTIRSGDVKSGTNPGGAITLRAGDALTIGTGGKMVIRPGNSPSGTPGDLEIQTGAGTKKLFITGSDGNTNYDGQHKLFSTTGKFDAAGGTVQHKRDVQLNVPATLASGEIYAPTNSPELIVGLG